MQHNLKREILFLPNILTFLRIFTIPVILYFIDNESPKRSYIAALLYGATALTDFADGYLARKWQQISLLGKFLDPLADKLLVMATLIWMVSLMRIKAWLVVVLLTRELGINALRSIASSEGLVIAARQMGKQKTAFQLIGILCLIIHFKYPVIYTDLMVNCHRVGLLTLYISLVFSIFSALDYINLFARAVHQGSPHQETRTEQTS